MYPSKEQALDLMKELNIPRNIIDHQLSVMRKARGMAHEIEGVEIDYELVRIGGLIHDIGRFETHGLGHGASGGNFVRELGYSEKLARVIECHVMGGISEDEAMEFHIPIRDYIPLTIEEKIVCLSDKYFSGSEQVTIEERFQKWIDKHGETPFLINQMQRVKKLEEEILRLIFNKNIH